MIFSAISLLRLKKCSSSSRTLIDQVGADFGVAEFVLGLRFEHRVLQANRHRADHAFAHVVAFEFLLAVFVHGLEQAFAEGAQVRAAVAGVLAVDEGIKRFAVAAVAVRETELERLAPRNAAADKSARCRRPADLPSPGPADRCGIEKSCRCKISFRPVFR